MIDRELERRLSMRASAEEKRRQAQLTGYLDQWDATFPPWACERCGACVSDEHTELHDTWHERNK